MSWRQASDRGIPFRQLHHHHDDNFVATTKRMNWKDIVMPFLSPERRIASSSESQILRRRFSVSLANHGLFAVTPRVGAVILPVRHIAG